MKNLFTRLLSFLPYIVLEILVGLLFIFVYRNDSGEVLNLLDVLIWPTVVLMALLFFREVFTYLFFSMEEFNFFGTKGKLKNVKEVILEKAMELYTKQKQTEEISQNELTLKRQIEKLKSDKETTSKEWGEAAAELLAEYKKVNASYIVLLKEKNQKDAQINALLNQIQESQKH